MKAVIMACLAAALPLAAAEPLQVYIVPKAPDNVSASNMTSPDLWKDVPRSQPLKLALTDGNARTLTQATDFQVTYNNRAFFVKVNCCETQTGRIDFQSKPPMRDTEKVYAAPNVEFFLDPELTRKTAAQVIVSANGGVFDRLNGETNWNHPVESRVERGEGFWTLYVAFPWKDRGMDNVFGMSPVSNPLIGFNICRNRMVGDNESSQWALTGKAFLRPSDFGVLVLSGEQASASLIKRHFSGAMIAGGIEIQGATRSFSGDFPKMRDIYLSTLRDNLATGERLLSLASKEKRAEHEKGYAEIKAEIGKDLSEAQIKDYIRKCSALNAELEKKTFDRLSNDLLNEF